VDDVKELVVKTIQADVANDFIRANHYSKRVVRNSQLHFGVFWMNRLHGALQFGPSLDKRKMLGLVEGSKWNEFLELNRLAFDEALPRNSESRALAVCFRIIRRNAPWIKWVVSFADGTQCGDGTIYRASGFILTDIKVNRDLWVLPDGTITHSMNMKPAVMKKVADRFGGKKFSQVVKELGAQRLIGFQLRYIYFLDPAYRARLKVAEIPFSEIQARGAAMYKGVRRACGRGETDYAPGPNRETGGASPTRPLNSDQSGQVIEVET
jgi:hypothetical protein